MKTVLFILQTAPYSSLSQIEAIETVMFAASFDHPTSVLFQQAGIMQLDKTQPPPKGCKNIAKMLSALPAFNIKNIYAREQDLQTYNLKLENLVISPCLISESKINQLKLNYDVLITY